MTKRDFTEDAWEIARRYGQPGDLAIARKAIEFGYSIGIHDATKEMEKLRKELTEFRERNNAPQ